MPIINFDFLNNKWVPVNGYLNKNSSLCSSIVNFRHIYLFLQKIYFLDRNLQDKD
jgi:hypothetical protein